MLRRRLRKRTASRSPRVLATPPVWIVEALEQALADADGIIALNTALMHDGRSSTSRQDDRGRFRCRRRHHRCGRRHGFDRRRFATSSGSAPTPVSLLVEDLPRRAPGRPQPADATRNRRRRRGCPHRLHPRRQLAGPIWSAGTSVLAPTPPTGRCSLADGDGLNRNELRLDFDGEHGNLRFCRRQPRPAERATPTRRW